MAQLGEDAVTVISAEPIPAELGPAVVIPGLDGIDDALVALVYLVYAQYLALFTSLECGEDAGQPVPVRRSKPRRAGRHHLSDGR